VIRKSLTGLLILVGSTLACVRSQPEYVIVTSTPPILNESDSDNSPEELLLHVTVVPPFVEDFATLTPDPTRDDFDHRVNQDYVVQPGDTLSGIANTQGISLSALLEVNDLVDPNMLSVGQIIRLPDPPSEQTPDFKIIPDSRLVRAPDSNQFDIELFISQQPGYIRQATDKVNDDILTAPQIVQRISLEYSVDARLLLALLELRSNWLTKPNISDEAKIYPLGARASPLGFDRNGLYRQLAWTADQLNRGYYGWKYRGLITLEFEDGERLRFAPGLNAGTVGVQYMLAQFNTYHSWQHQISELYQIYTAYFGDPFANAIEPLVPSGLQQPELTLPFPSGETWFFTGGAHGGWGAGSAWAAIDFAPPDDLTGITSSCYLSSYWAVAVAAGVIARTDEGIVILDLDGDGDESTGWTILYLHIAEQDRIEAGIRVQPGDRIGRPSCEGGFSNGTHIHIARRYNGEWIPADCSQCPPDQAKPSFVMSGWRVESIIGQEYQGYLVRGDERRIAEQGRLSPENHVSW
jgi:LasA protease